MPYKGASITVQVNPHTPISLAQRVTKSLDRPHLLHNFFYKVRLGEDFCALKYPMRNVLVESFRDIRLPDRSCMGEGGLEVVEVTNCSRDREMK